jgi:hypothetical protein
MADHDDAHDYTANGPTDLGFRAAGDCTPQEWDIPAPRYRKRRETGSMSGMPAVAVALMRAVALSLLDDVLVWGLRLDAAAVLLVLLLGFLPVLGFPLATRRWENA